MHQISALFQKASLKIKPQKCKFRKTTTKYLKILVMSKGPQMDPSKVSEVEQWPILPSYVIFRPLSNFVASINDLSRTFPRLYTP
jgi:hypothetical protein